MQKHFVRGLMSSEGVTDAMGFLITYQSGFIPFNPLVLFSNKILKMQLTIPPRISYNNYFGKLPFIHN